MLDSAIERVSRHDRGVVLAGLVGVIAVAWAYLFWEAARMAAPMDGMASPMASDLAGAFFTTFLMWAVMMVGMMLPSAGPAILLYGGIVRKNRERGQAVAAVYVFAAGYLIVWTAFSVIVAAFQVLLGQLELLSPMMVSTSTVLSGIFLLAAGLYQWFPVKQACLRICRSPLSFFTMHWRQGPAGALRMGLEHGVICVGCCWSLMLLLFIGGVMNLVWVAVVAGFILVEKLLPKGRLTAQFAGVGLIAAGLAVLLGVLRVGS